MITKDNLVEGLKILTSNGTCLEYVGPAENTDGDPCQSFELFETGSCIFCPDVGIEEEIVKHGFVAIPMQEWRRRIVALEAFQKNRSQYVNYLGTYMEQAEVLDHEILKAYEKLQPV
ncbi:MAG: hypothetical protein KAG61_09060 [Bacteriovoracaceae bacterium]|nr:hypothetical protein [Bacteriovoracaceae bacterium]